jgi:hydrogenase expression/formation protein HypC
MCLAIPGKLIEIQDEAGRMRSGRVDFSGVVREVNLACVPEARPGDYVIVHVGMAISVVDEEEARQVFEYLRQMDELGELEESDDALPGRVS